MTWRDAVTLAWVSVRRRAGRAALTVLAVALAAALLTALLSIAGTARTRVLNQLSKGGPLAGIKVAAAEPDPTQVDSDNPRPGAAKDLDDGALGRIRAVPGVHSVIPVMTTRVVVVPPNPPYDEAALAEVRKEPVAVAGRDPVAGRLRLGRRGGEFAGTGRIGETMVGVPIASAGQLPITVITGRLPAPGALTEVAVTQGYLERFGLKKSDAPAVVGTEIEVGAPQVGRIGGDVRIRGRWTRALVVGVVAQEAAAGQLLAPIEAVRPARQWSAASTEDLGGLSPGTSPYTGVFVVASGLDRVSRVRQSITDIGYSTSAPENLIASVQRYLKVVEIVLSAIGFIALSIAALGITNALLAAVRERRREIGVLKAVGARDRDVLRVFLFEAGLLGFVGGLIGTVAGFSVARGVGSIVNGYLTRQGLAGVKLPLPLGLLAAAVAGSTLLALVAGAAPALRAARMPAREAIGSV